MIAGIIVHGMQPDELGFVAKSWKMCALEDLEQTRYGKIMSSDQRWALVNRAVNISMPTCAVRVCVSPGEVEVAHGWVALRGGRLVYGYVKPRYRKMGVYKFLRAQHEAAWSGYDPLLELDEGR